MNIQTLTTHIRFVRMAVTAPGRIYAIDERDEKQVSEGHELTSEGNSRYWEVNEGRSGVSSIAHRLS